MPARARSGTAGTDQAGSEESKPVSMRTAAADNVIAVVLVNEITERVGFVQLTTIG